MTRDARLLRSVAGISAPVKKNERDGEELHYLTSRTTFVRLPEMISDELSLNAGSSAGYSLMQPLAGEGEAHCEIEFLMSALASPPQGCLRLLCACRLTPIRGFDRIQQYRYAVRGV
jgi:hypothetical protein